VQGSRLIEPLIAGSCQPEFHGVRKAFRQNFVERGEVGASLCVIRGGEVIVDLWGGWIDEACTTPWEQDTLVDFYSVGKAIVATPVLQLVDRGAITLDTAVADVWPEFASGGKEAVTIRQALCHEAAVPAIRESLTEDLSDWATMTTALASTEAWWPIGTRHAYHTNTYGFLCGEIVRRITGELPGEALRRIADPLDADIFFGVPVEEQARCADVIWAPETPTPTGPFDTSTLDGDTLMNVLAHFNPPGASSIGFADPDAGIAFGYVMNHVIPRWQSTRNRALIDALYAHAP